MSKARGPWSRCSYVCVLEAECLWKTMYLRSLHEIGLHFLPCASLMVAYHRHGLGCFSKRQFHNLDSRYFRSRPTLWRSPFLHAAIRSARWCQQNTPKLAMFSIGWPRAMLRSSFHTFSGTLAVVFFSGVVSKILRSKFVERDAVGSRWLFD